MDSARGAGDKENSAVAGLTVLLPCVPQGLVLKGMGYGTGMFSDQGM